jgi:hypothetical protein
MTAPVRKDDLKLDPVEIFIARAKAKALLWTNGELSLHDAVDELWAAAVNAALVDEFGADQVQELLAQIFAPYREELERELLSATDAAARCLADELRVQELYRDPEYVPKATLDAAEYLMREGDPERLRAWFARHSPAQRKAIFLHLEQRRKARSA